jgi:hypothetical protein
VAADLSVMGPPATRSDPVQAADSGGRGAAWVFDFDLAGLLNELGLGGSGGADDDQEDILTAKQEALDAYGGDQVDLTAQIAEHLPTGPGLAAILASCAPGEAADRDLPGIATACRRLASWAQARELAAVAEIAARSAAANPRIGANDQGKPKYVPPEAAAQVALAMQMSQLGASGWVALAVQLRWTLPSTGAALAAGVIDLARTRIIAEGTSVLSDELAQVVEGRVLPGAADQTTGQLRAAVQRAVIAADPGGAEQRRKDAELRAKVSLYPDEQGTATLTGSSLPGIHAAAAMARISAMARALRASGTQGCLDLLRAHVYLGLLVGTMPIIPAPADGPPDTAPVGEGPLGTAPAEVPPNAAPSAPPDTTPAGEGPRYNPPADEPRGDATVPSASGGQTYHACSPSPEQDIPWPTDDDAPQDDGGDVLDSADELRSPDDNNDHDDDDWAAAPAPDWPELPDQLPAASADPTGVPEPAMPPAGLLDLLVPWSALAGHSCEPAMLSRIGPITGLQAHLLLVLAARSAKTQWRVIVTDDDGRALAVQRGRPGWAPRHQGYAPTTTGVVGRVTVTIQASSLGTPLAACVDASVASREIAAMVLRAAARATAAAQPEQAADAQAGGCAHTTASAGYRPPPRIREFVAARDKTCRFSTCGQPAWRADLDHTVPWHEGGPTCRCNLGACCRTHHKIKQLPGWRLEQPQPGIFRWTTEAGRSYAVEPDRYPV